MKTKTIKKSLITFKNPLDVFVKTVSKVGNSGHVILPVGLIGKKVTIIVKR